MCTLGINTFSFLELGRTADWSRRWSAIVAGYKLHYFLPRLVLMGSPVFYYYFSVKRLHDAVRNCVSYMVSGDSHFLFRDVAVESKENWLGNNHLLSKVFSNSQYREHHLHHHHHLCH